MSSNKYRPSFQHLSISEKIQDTHFAGEYGFACRKKEVSRGILLRGFAGLQTFWGLGIGGGIIMMYGMAAVVLISYLLGGISTGYILVRFLKNEDVRN